MAIKIPTSVTDPTPVAKKGWTATTAQGVLTFAGGEDPVDVRDQGDDAENAHDIDVPGDSDVPERRNGVDRTIARGKPEPDHPAPQVSVVK